MLVVTVTVGLLGTVFVAATPMRLAYRSLPGHVALATAEAVIGLLVVGLLYGRFLRSRTLPYLLVAVGVAMLAGANVVAVVGAVANADPESVLNTWLPVMARLAGVAIIAAGAASRSRRFLTPERAVPVASVLGACSLAAIALATVALESRLPAAVDVQRATTTSSPRIDGHPAVLAMQLTSGLLFALTAAAFARRARAEKDELFSWFSAGTALAAIAGLNYLLVPSLYTDYVYSGDVFRFLSYTLYLAGGVRELTSYWRANANAAVSDERRRVARNLHDGLAQELAFISTQARLLPQNLPTEQLVSAADRALDESRAAIELLSTNTDGSLDVVIERAATEVAGRHGIGLKLDIAREADASRALIDTLARVVREAITNAARHGRARHVVVRVDPGPPMRLTVSDDGGGFELATPRRPGAMGLVSMEERCASVGATFTIRGVPGSGTLVEVVVP